MQIYQHKIQCYSNKGSIICLRRSILPASMNICNTDRCSRMDNFLHTWYKTQAFTSKKNLYGNHQNLLQFWLKEELSATKWVKKLSSEISERKYWQENWTVGEREKITSHGLLNSPKIYFRIYNSLPWFKNRPGRVNGW